MKREVFQLYLLLWCVVFLSFGSEAQNKSLRIGYIIDTTGIGSFFGTQTQAGTLLALKELRTPERDIEILFEEFGGKTSRAVSGVLKLLNQDKVDAVICDLTAPCTAISQKVHDAGKILIYHSPAPSIYAANRYAFRNFIDYTDACERMSLQWRREGITAIGSLNANLEFGEKCLEGIYKEYPSHFAFRNNPGDDLASAVLSFKSKNLSHVIFTGYEGDFIHWIKLSSEQQTPLYPGFTEILLTDTFWNSIQTYKFEGLVAGFDALPENFLKRVQSLRSPTSINPQAAALAYNAVHSLVLAADVCPTRDLSCMRQNLETPHDPWLLGFRGWGKDHAPYPIVLKQLQGQTLTPLGSGRPS